MARRRDLEHLLLRGKEVSGIRTRLPWRTKKSKWQRRLHHSLDRQSQNFWPSINVYRNDNSSRYVHTWFPCAYSRFAPHQIIDVDPEPSLGNSSQDLHTNPDLSGLQNQPQSNLDAAATPTTPTLAYDPTWLAITRAFHPYFTLTRTQLPFPDEPTARASVETELTWVMEHVPKKLGGWEITACQQFWRGVPDVEQEARRNDGQREFCLCTYL